MSHGNWIKVGSSCDWDQTDRKTFQHFSVFKSDGFWFACENRCPHMGYPMNKGTIRDGVITCAWHNWEFDSKNGGCLRGACDDLKTYEVKIEKEEVLVLFEEPGQRADFSPLKEAMRAGDLYQQAKCIHQLIEQQISVEKICGFALSQAYHHSERNHMTEQAIYESQAILDAFQLSNYLEDEKAIVLLQGIRTASGSTGDRMEVKVLPEKSTQLPLDALFIKYVKDASPLGLERILISQPFLLNDWKHLVLESVCQIPFLAMRDATICLSAIYRLMNLYVDNEHTRAFLAQTAWLLGRPRREADPETKIAQAWLQNHLPTIADTYLGDKTFDCSDELENIASLSNVDSMFEAFTQLLSRQCSYEKILDSFSLMAARRFSRLWLNNGGMWNSASEGVRLCYALRALKITEPQHQVFLLYQVLYYFFQTRWLQMGQAWKNTVMNGSLEKNEFVRFFTSSEDKRAREAYFALGFRSPDQIACTTILEPMVKEDLSAIQLNTLQAFLEEAKWQEEWQSYLAGLITYAIDQKLQQNVKSADKFGKSYS